MRFCGPLRPLLKALMIGCPAQARKGMTYRRKMAKVRSQEGFFELSPWFSSHGIVFEGLDGADRGPAECMGMYPMARIEVWYRFSSFSPFSSSLFFFFVITSCGIDVSLSAAKYVRCTCNIIYNTCCIEYHIICTIRCGRPWVRIQKLPQHPSWITDGSRRSVSRTFLF